MSAKSAKIWYDKNWKKYNQQFKQALDSIKTGFTTLDESQVFNPGLYILGGSPSVGKSTFGFQLGCQFAKHNQTVLFVSCELDIDFLFSKLIMSQTKCINQNVSIPSTKIRAGFTNPSVLAALQEIKTVDWTENFYVEQSNGYNISEVLEQMEKFCATVNPNPIIIIDYLQYIESDNSHETTTTKQKIDSIIRNLKSFQTSHKIFVILLSSFNRSSYRVESSMESFKESGDIDGTADVMWSLQYTLFNKKLPKIDRDGNKTYGVSLREFKREQRKTPRKITLTCLKNRFGGLYDVNFDYYSEYDYFEENGDSYEIVTDESSEKKKNKERFGG